MKNFWIPLVTVLAMLVVSQARADTDQRCLSACINGGQGASVCMPQCTYNAKPKGDAAAAADDQDVTTNPYRVLDTLTPVEGSVVVSEPQRPASQQAALDRSCVETCLKQGLQYDLCNQRCTKPDCPPGSVLCLNQKSGLP